MNVSLEPDTMTALSLASQIFPVATCGIAANQEANPEAKKLFRAVV